MNKFIAPILTLSLLAAFSCSAATAAPAIQKASGKVTVVKVDGLTLQNKKTVDKKVVTTTYNILIDKNTKVKKAGKDVPFSDISVGTSVTVSGIAKDNEKNTLVAKSITIAVTAKDVKTDVKAVAPVKTIEKYDFGASVSDGIFRAFGSLFSFIGGLF